MVEMSEFVGIRDHPERRGIATVVLSRPPTNALTRQACRELAAAAETVSRRDDVAAVIFFGGHEIFCAGDDVPELRTLTPAEAGVAARVRHEAIAAVAAIPKPTVAAVTGYALGSGLTLALAADWRISGDNVKFGATENLAGLVPDGFGMARLARTVGAGRAKELAYSGRFFDAEEALALGVIDDLVAPDDVYDAALAWAGRFLGTPAAALSAAKAGIDEVFTLDAPARQAAVRRRYVAAFTASYGTES